MGNSVWYQLAADTRDNIKQALLSNLGNNQQAQVDTSFMKDLCMCIASIAVVEIPTGSWPDFVDLMCKQGIQNEN